uniref:Uncharacterized protein n=1 Tax=Pseudonaja textilis TaxID=8673 RepID=A0A670Y951_PSETE
LHLVAFAEPNLHRLCFLLQKRKVLVTLIETCLPLLFAAILIGLRHRVHSVNHPNATLYHSKEVNELPSIFHRRHLGVPWELAYVPSNNTAVQNIAKRVEKDLKIEARWFPSEKEFERYIRFDNHSGNILAGVVFENCVANSQDPLPLQVRCSLGWSLQGHLLKLVHEIRLKYLLGEPDENVTSGAPEPVESHPGQEVGCNY